jgi:uncharacterized Fe-S center protein
MKEKLKMQPAKVLFSSMAFSRYDPDQTLPAKFGRMLLQTGLAKTVKNKSVAIKLHVGDNLGYSTIPPVFIRILVAFVKKNGGDCFITDHNIQSRHPENRGYTETTLGCPVLEACGHLGSYIYTRPVNYKTFKHAEIAGLIHDADVLINLSHVKGHGVCGYGGACKNIAMGCVTDRTRREIHSLEGGIEWDADLCSHCDQCIASCSHDANSFSSKGAYRINFHHCTACQHCVKVCPTGALVMNDLRFSDFQTGMAICTKAVLDTFAPGNVYHINVLTAITALCDCWGMTTPAMVPDIGIMASSDLVALEYACLDAIKVENLIPGSIPEGYNLSGHGHLFEQLHGKNPLIQMIELEKQGVGQRQYELVSVL